MPISTDCEPRPVWRDEIDPSRSAGTGRPGRDEGRRWYRHEASLSTADRFIDALEATYASIATDPRIGSSRYAHQLGLKGLRFRILDGFPYLVFYAEQDDRIEVWRVLHAHRDLPREIDDGSG